MVEENYLGHGSVLISPLWVTDVELLHVLRLGMDFSHISLPETLWFIEIHGVANTDLLAWSITPVIRP